ncbi:MAG: sucrase ferredoxin [Phenylobacterium sp.]|nr:sucrase ferredoxin [Phenylobacterium sp.]
MTHPFCSRLAASAHGVIAGTGVVGEIYVFLPVDKKRWGRREFNESWASAPELEAIRRARKAGVTVRLYDPPREPALQAILLYPSPSPSSRATLGLQDLLTELGHRRWSVDDTGRARLALCTQGTRDRCCAKWGFALYREALALHDSGDFAFEPIECSHLGGDRFAATGIVFPSGSMYGHLDQLPLPDLASAEREQRVLPNHYRGRVFESPLTQVVRAGLAQDGFPVTTVSDVAIEGPTDGAAPLSVIAAGRRYEVTLSRRSFEFYGDCRAAAQSRVSRESRLAYSQAKLVEPLSGTVTAELAPPPSKPAESA